MCSLQCFFLEPPLESSTAISALKPLINSPILTSNNFNYMKLFDAKIEGWDQSWQDLILEWGSVNGPKILIGILVTINVFILVLHSLD